MRITLVAWRAVRTNASVSSSTYDSHLFSSLIFVSKKRKKIIETFKVFSQRNKFIWNPCLFYVMWVVDRVRMTPPAVETLQINVYSSVSHHCIYPLCDWNRLYIPSISSVYMFALDVAVKVCLRMRLLHFLVFAPLFYFIFAFNHQFLCHCSYFSYNIL